MEDEAPLISDHKALEKAVKYICNPKDGLCPTVVEKIECRIGCTLETLPWQCWLAMFKETAEADRNRRDETG